MWATSKLTSPLMAITLQNVCEFVIWVVLFTSLEDVVKKLKLELVKPVQHSIIGKNKCFPIEIFLELSTISFLNYCTAIAVWLSDLAHDLSKHLQAKHIHMRPIRTILGVWMASITNTEIWPQQKKIP